MKKFLSVVLAILMVVSIMPTGVFSITASAATSGYYTYTVDGATGLATITDVDATISGDIVIPSNFDIIGDYAFEECKNLTSITIPDSIQSIGDFAFSSCEGLTNVLIGGGVTSIGYGAFRDCTALTNIILPNGVKSIGEDAFYNTEYFNNENNWNNKVLYIGEYLIKASEAIKGTHTIKDGTIL